MSDDQSVERAIDVDVSSAGQLDIVIASAGIGAQGTIEDNDEEWRRVFEVNVFGAARIARAAMPHLRSSSAGSLEFTSSIAAAAGLQDRALYSASKGALNAMTLAIAADSVAFGARVNAVAPGTADTPWIDRLLSRAADPQAERDALEQRQPLGRLVRPEEVADSGLLARDVPDASATFDYLPAPSEFLERARGLAEVCVDFKVPLRLPQLHSPYDTPPSRRSV